MRIIITDENEIWTPDNPALEPYADIVVVVCLNGKAVTENYDCYVTSYAKGKQTSKEYYGIADEKLSSLYSDSHDFVRGIVFYDEVVILADSNPASLYPFMVLKDIVKDRTMHLCAVKPSSLENEYRRKAYNNIFENLIRLDSSTLNSLFYMDSDALFHQLAPGSTLEDLRQKEKSLYEELLPRILYGIQEEPCQRMFFDFYSKSYLPLADGYNMIEQALLSQKKIDINEIKREKEKEVQLGLILPRLEPKDSDRAYQEVESLRMRVDGKAVCNYLRNLRLELARENNIVFKSEECPSTGACAGTCEKCDSEATYLFRKMQEIPIECRKYPQRILRRWEGMK